LAQAPCWRASSLGALERKNPKDAVQDAPVVDTRHATRLVRMATDASNRQNETTGISEIYPLTGHAAGTPKPTLRTQDGPWPVRCTPLPFGPDQGAEELLLLGP